MILDDLSLKIPEYNNKTIQNSQHFLNIYKNPKDLLTENIKDSKDLLKDSYDFILFTMDLSYFSGKLEMYLNYKEINYLRYEPSAREFDLILYSHTGTEQLPQLYDKRKNILENKRWLRDTTGIIEYFEDFLQNNQQINNKLILTSNEFYNFFLFLFEDYSDEFLWRPAMFLRWEPNFDRSIMGLRFYYEFLYEIQDRFCYVPPFLRRYTSSLRQWIVSSFGEDITTKEKKEVVINQYLELLDILQDILSKQPFLFENYPTLIDIGFSGPFFRHFSSDFTARKIMQQRAPAVYEWIARLWNSRQTNFMSIESKLPSFGEEILPTNWKPLLGLLKDYLYYYSLNRIAINKGEKYFQWNYKDQLFTVPIVPYRSWCLMKLQQRYKNLTIENQLKIKDILIEYSCWDYFITGYDEIIPPECGIEPPFVVYPPPTKRVRLAEKWDYDSIIIKYFWVSSKKWIFRGILFGGIGIILKLNKFSFHFK